MRSLKLRFPYAGQQARSADYILLALGLLVFVVCLYQLKLIMEEIAHWDARIYRLEQQQQHRKTPRTPIARINGEARNLAALTDFVEAIEREDVFENAYLLSYKVKKENPHRPIVFSLTATWIDLP